jgi:hypothetical protein
MSEYLDAWRCIGCGRVEAARPCVGICQDRRVRLVDAEDYEAAVERARVAEDALRLVRRLAGTQPRAERWRDSFVAFRGQARKILDDLRDVEGAVAEILERSSA